MEQIFTIPWKAGNGARNMALDEALLRHADAEGTVQGALRFYGWDGPAITFGYGQVFDLIAPLAEQRGCGLTRRITGGGVVNHGEDLTFALALLPTSAWYRRAAAELYRALHSGISEALRRHGIDSTLQVCNPDVPCPTRPAFAEKQCFLSPEPLDVIGERGEKLAGAAMKRDRRGLLVQGSIEIPDRLLSQRHQLLDAILNEWALSLETTWKESTEIEIHQSAEYARLLEKYSSDQWNRRR